MAKNMTWREAVAELTAERQRAESAARIIKRLSAGTDISDMQIAYDEGRAETEAVISALAIALHEGSPDQYPDDFDKRIARDESVVLFNTGGALKYLDVLSR